MHSETAEYILKMSDGKEIVFESDLPGKYMNQFLKENNNVWDETKFVAFVKSFQKIIFKYSLHLL